MRKIFDRIESDHKALKNSLNIIADQVSLPDSGQTARGSVYQLQLELTKHFQAEEAALYEPLKRFDSALVGQLSQEHQNFISALRDLRDTNGSSESWLSRFNATRESIIEHFSHEEQMAFTILERRLSKVELDDLALEYQRLKSRFTAGVDSGRIETSPTDTFSPTLNP